MKKQNLIPLLIGIGVLCLALFIAPHFGILLPAALAAGTILGDLNGQTTNLSLLGAQQATSTKTQATATDISGFAGQLKFILDAGAASAGTTPTLDVTIEDSANGTTDFKTVGTFSQVTDTASLQSLGIETRALRKYVRAVATIAGTNTPTFAFSVHAEGQKQYI